MARYDEDWLKRLEQLLRRKERQLNQAGAALRRARQDIASTNEEIDLHRGRRGQPWVLKRTTPGPRVEIYHSADHPCGRAVNRASFKRIPLGEAVDQGLRPCTACAWDLRLSSTLVRAAS
jgi:hypothetical protein